jgi:hypothetical protein
MKQKTNRNISHLYSDRMPHVANFALLQWRVVDGIAKCSLKLLFRRTRQTSSDKSATASNAGRYLQG